MAHRNSVNIRDLLECTMCHESYTDPRVMICGHQFCLQCVASVAVKHGSFQDMIVCPACGEDTPIKKGLRANSLAKPASEIQIQLALRNLVGSQKRISQKCCDSCEEDITPATMYCYQCHQNMCDGCLMEHKRQSSADGHKAVPITDSLCCGIHNNIVTLLCHDCNKGICSRCAVIEHCDHTTENIRGVASELRSKMKDIISNLVTPIGVSHTQVNTIINELQETQDNITSQINKLVDTLRNLEGALLKTQAEVIAQTSADMEALKVYQSDVLDITASRASLVEYGKYLLEKGSDPEVVHRAQEFASASYMRNIGKPPIIHHPAAESLGRIASKLTPLMDLCTVDYVKDFFLGDTNAYRNFAGTMENMKFTQEVGLNFYGNIWDVIFIPKFSWLAVRAERLKSSIKVYNLTGDLVKEMGAGINGLADGGCLAYDLKRDLYLAPCDDHLTTIDLRGNVHDVIQCDGSNLCGVAYCSSTDRYVVTDINKHRVLIVDAKFRKVVNSFDPKQSSDIEFVYPHHVCAGEIDKVPVVVISDFTKHKVKVYDMSGNHLKTYGSYGTAEGLLRRPQGVAVDMAGRVVVADYDNMRVVSFWTDGGEDRWEVVLSEEQLGGRPWLISIDPLNQMFAAHMSKTKSIQLYSFE